MVSFHTQQSPSPTISSKRWALIQRDSSHKYFYHGTNSSWCISLVFHSPVQSTVRILQYFLKPTPLQLHFVVQTATASKTQRPNGCGKRLNWARVLHESHHRLRNNHQPPHQINTAAAEGTILKELCALLNYKVTSLFVSIIYLCSSIFPRECGWGSWWFREPPARNYLMFFAATATGWP